MPCCHDYFSYYTGLHCTIIILIRTMPRCHGYRCEYAHQDSLGSQQQTDDHAALLAPVGYSHPAGDDEDTHYSQQR